MKITFLKMIGETGASSDLAKASGSLLAPGRRSVAPVAWKQLKFIPLLVCAIVLAFSHCVAGASVTVFAAASLTDSLKEISAAYERSSGDKLVFSFGASSQLARQIEEGAPADVFFSADEAKMNGLEKKGLIFNETRASRLSNSLVIVVAQRGAQISHPNDLASDKVKRLALAETKTVPAGIYAREYLEKALLWRRIEKKVIPTENVRAALAAVEAGNVEAAIVYKTDAAISRKVRIAYQIPASDHPAISYPLAVIKQAKQVDAARRFVKYLESEAAASIFQKYGFIVRD